MPMVAIKELVAKPADPEIVRQESEEIRKWIQTY